MGTGLEHMMTLAIISLLAGMVLGQRFKVLILVPATALALAFTVGVGIAQAEAVWSIVQMAAVTAAALQIGYLAGIGIRHGLVAARASRVRATSLAASARRHGIAAH